MGDEAVSKRGILTMRSPFSRSSDEKRKETESKNALISSANNFKSTNYMYKCIYMYIKSYMVGYYVHVHVVDLKMFALEIKVSIFTTHACYKSTVHVLRICVCTNKHLD